MDAAKMAMRAIVMSYLREQSANNVMGFPGGRFDQPLLNLPYVGGSKHTTDATFIATLWDLVAEGILLPGHTEYQRYLGNDDKKMWPFYSITPYGLDVLAGRSETTSPHDLTRYLAEAKERLPNGDDAIALYLEEANRAFVARLYLSSVVMLGVSAEALSEWLVKAMRKHLQMKSAALSAFDKDMVRLELKSAARFGRLMQEVSAHSSEFPRDLKALVESQLVTILNILKTYRDDVAHRRPFRIDPQLADGQLKLYLPTLSVASELSDALCNTCTSP